MPLGRGVQYEDRVPRRVKLAMSLSPVVLKVLLKIGDISNNDVIDVIMVIYFVINIIEGSLEVKLPTIWTVEKQR